MTRRLLLTAALTGGVALAAVSTGFHLPANLKATGAAITPKKDTKYVDIDAFIRSAAKVTRASVQAPHPLVREVIWYPGRENLDRPQGSWFKVPAGPDNLMLQFVAGSGTLHTRQWVDAQGQTRVAGMAALMAPPFVKGNVMYVSDDFLTFNFRCSLLQRKGFAVCPTEHGTVSIPVTRKTF
ncbi:hypothetical protein GCM10008955_40610 [Deinococcus malanensis]|uniref:DUF1684 domain-containing protein n=1 Tax=Deinococcus malanensis TaxID=1706855 RepID=A0ABQ2F2T0_9DEIO|nr:hypothetical protein [Deinococcus malanensis]GGK42731.1 hypothetical protein GCM10008955_40610 [Deinococcus malanensis]